MKPGVYELRVNNDLKKDIYRRDSNTYNEESWRIVK